MFTRTRGALIERFLRHVRQFQFGRTADPVTHFARQIQTESRHDSARQIQYAGSDIAILAAEGVEMTRRVRIRSWHLGAMNLMWSC